MRGPVFSVCTEPQQELDFFLPFLAFQNTMANLTNQSQLAFREICQGITSVLQWKKKMQKVRCNKGPQDKGQAVLEDMLVSHCESGFLLGPQNYIPFDV